MQAKWMIVTGFLIILLTTLRLFRRWRILDEIRPAKTIESTVDRGDRDPTHYPHCVLIILDGVDDRSTAHRVEQRLNALPGVWATVDYTKKEALVRMKLELSEAKLHEAVRMAGCMILIARKVKIEEVESEKPKSL